jgi:hypothetical protein
MKTNYLKLGVLGLMMMVGSAINAQQTTGDVTQNDVNGPNTPGSVTPTVRVIDNKGTIKYLQSKNGITMLTNTTADVTTTTWQLGGTLTDDTYIDATGKIFAIEGIKQVDDAAFSAAEQTGATAYGGPGFTLLVRDEVTGETKKLLPSDLVVGGNENGKATSGADFTSAADPTMPTSISKIWVYRNGAKLLAGVDYTIAGGAGASVVTVKNASGAAPEDYIFYTGDRIEIQWVR